MAVVNVGEPSRRLAIGKIMDTAVNMKTVTYIYVTVYIYIYIYM
jgi:hypothetical protein